MKNRSQTVLEAQMGLGQGGNEWNGFVFFRLLQAGAELEHPIERLTSSVVFDLWV